MRDGETYTSSAFLNQLLDNTTDRIYFKDRKSRFLLLNQACFAAHGWDSPDEIIGKTDFDVFTKEHAEQAFADEQKIIESGKPLLSIEEKETWPDGSVTWVSTAKMPLRDEDGTILGTFGISRDITTHKLNEIKLEKYARKLTQINEQMEDDLHMAANLQQAFLPQSYPTFADERCVQFFHRYIASTQVSGDLCAVHKLSDTEAGMLVCDVMGHGVRAALITAIVHTMIGELAQKNLSPGEFFSEMNRQLRPVFKSQDAFIFVTASYLILNTETGVLRGASAGHPTPFIVRSNDSVDAEPLQMAENVNGPALAVVQNIEYQTFEMQLNPGDAIIMYTDGVLEEPNDEDEEFGMERTQAALNAQPDNHPETLCDGLINTVCDFHECTQLGDDICLIAFRWNGPSAS